MGEPQAPRWSLWRTELMAAPLGLLVTWGVAWLGWWPLPWWQGMLLGAAVGAVMGWWGGRRRPGGPP